jgi:hypothetical protein
MYQCRLQADKDEKEKNQAQHFPLSSLFLNFTSFCLLFSRWFSFQGAISRYYSIEIRVVVSFTVGSFVNVVVCANSEQRTANRQKKKDDSLDFTFTIAPHTYHLE